MKIKIGDVVYITERTPYEHLVGKVATVIAIKYCSISECNWFGLRFEEGIADGHTLYWRGEVPLLDQPNGWWAEAPSLAHARKAFHGELLSKLKEGDIVKALSGDMPRKRCTIVSVNEDDVTYLYGNVTASVSRYGLQLVRIKKGKNHA